LLLIGAALCANAPSAHGQSLPTCEQVRGTPANAKRTEFTARRALASKSQDVAVQADGVVHVIAHRISLATSRARIVMTRLDGEPGGIAGCDSGWFSTDRIVTVRAPAPPPGPHPWRISVFDESNGGPTGEFPDLIDVQIVAPVLKAAEDFPHDTKFDGAAASEPSTACGSASQSQRPGLRLIESARHHTELPPQASSVMFAHAGRRAYLSLTADRGAVVDVRMYAKEGGGRAFTGICLQTVRLGVNDSYVLGAIPWDRLQTPVWRIEVSAVAPENLTERNDLRVTMAVFREENPALNVAPLASDKKLRNALQLLSESYQCRATFRRARREPRGTPPSPPEPIVNPLPTALVLSTDTRLNADERATLLRSLRAALGVWVANCSACNFDVFSVIRVDDMLWIRSDFADPAMSHARARMGNTPVQQLALDRFVSRAMTAVSGNELYQQVNAEKVQSLEVCSLNDATLPIDVQRVRNALGCGTGTARTKITKLKLLIRNDGVTSCGTSSNDIACEADSGLLELNTRDYGFCIAQLGGVCLGEGVRRVDLLHVLLHEVGHWLELAHVDASQAMMASTMNQSRCISDADIDALRTQVSGASPASKATPQAFRLIRNEVAAQPTTH
jgi:hypothetical protein